MADKIYNVLFLCTGNSARSILGEAVMNKLGAGRFKAWSAGSQPKGEVHPMALSVLSGMGYDTIGMYSKSWSEFSKPGSPEFDFIFTVCDSAAGEACPVWIGHPMTAHWGIEDPAPVERDVLGLTLSEMSDELRQQLDLKPEANGLVVRDVDPKSEAYEKGLRMGDVITEAGQQKVTSVADFEARVGDVVREISEGDIVIIPAFGTEVAILEKLKNKGCQFVDTTCGDVMSVWKRVRGYAKEEFTSIIHGKADHEETRATLSQATANNGHYLIVRDLDETELVCEYIIKGGDKGVFLKQFSGSYSKDFDPNQHLQSVGVANQTTMMRNETEEVQQRIRDAIVRRFGEENVKNHFRFFDTICGATQERQDALHVMLKKPMDLLLVIGGYNSSNTAHLAEMGESVLPTYFIKNAREMEDEHLIHHYNQHTHQVEETRDWLPNGSLTVGVTAGASCPNNLIEDVIRRLLELRGTSAEEVLTSP